MNELTCDVLIIGSGAAGGVLAATLAESTDHDILLVEKGGYFTKESFDQRELDMAKLYAENGSRSTSDGSMPVRGGECVGGGTTVNLALCFDPLPSVWSRWRDRFGLEAFSFDENANDYGIAGLDMPRCLAEVRRRLHVMVPAPEQINGNNRLLEIGCRRLGLTSRRFELNMRDCIGCGFCAQGCAYDRKQGTMVTYVADALQNGVQLLHHCDVSRVIIKRQGDRHVAIGAEGTVHPTQAGSRPNLVAPGPVAIRANLVIAAAGAIETPRLLQRSDHPDPYDRIGRGLVLHPSLPVIGVLREEITNYQGITGSVYSNHFFDSHGFYFECLFGHPVYGASLLPGLGAEHFELMRKYRQLGGFGVMLVDTSSDVNRVTHDVATQRTAIHYRLSDADKTRMRFAAQKAVEIMFAAGAESVILPSEEPVGPLPTPCFTTPEEAALCQQLQFLTHQTTITSAHPQATVKMGADVRQSVVNSRGESHHVKNLIACDSSVFPASCGANPMISIMTMARYQAKRIAAEWARYA